MSTHLLAKDALMHPDYLVDIKYITTLTGMTDKWFYSLMQQQKFPRPIKLGRASRWRLKEIEAWLATQTNH
ncbi:AlpA family phage regulatory protein [uncultured Gilliamella sp.]|uniref:helix-turn-helix transcriptional regulator n=1 Tax=uncultured Gilliamella sp. TaxID=1193505 RepID=UPI0025E20E8D|nr:AlpA family phage regulatory protein [uncultured Gilliamella sp.]